jgi:hypothetical protein
MIDISMRWEFGRELGRKDITKFGQESVGIGVGRFRGGSICINRG